MNVHLVQMQTLQSNCEQFEERQRTKVIEKSTDLPKSKRFFRSPNCLSHRWRRRSANQNKEKVPDPNKFSVRKVSKIPAFRETIEQQTNNDRNPYTHTHSTTIDTIAHTQAQTQPNLTKLSFEPIVVLLIAQQRCVHTVYFLYTRTHREFFVQSFHAFQSKFYGVQEPRNVTELITFLHRERKTTSCKASRIVKKKLFLLRDTQIIFVCKVKHLIQK